jgi:hypothetical protein
MPQVQAEFMISDINKAYFFMVLPSLHFSSAACPAGTRITEIGRSNLLGFAGFDQLALRVDPRFRRGN